MAGLIHLKTRLRNDAMRRLIYCFQAEGTGGPLKLVRFPKGCGLLERSERTVDMTAKRPADLALSWLVPAVGAVIFVTLQSFSFLNDYVSSGGTMQAMSFGPSALWGVSVFYGAWVLPPLLALAARRATDWAMLILGGILVAISTLAGVADGLRDGTHLVGLELLSVTLPGAIALLASWRHIRAT